jgi:Tol biopolymer transport system component
MKMHCVRLWMLPIMILSSFGFADAQDRIYIDEYMPLRSELMIASADGRNPRKLVPGAEIDYNASFSYDGQWVVFTSDRNGTADILRVRVDGTGLEQLTDSPAFDDQGALSPDNRFLAFVSTRDRGSTDIYIMDLKSREVRNLTNAPGGDFRPSWSPDGQTIAFSSDRGNGFPHHGYPGPAGRQEHLQVANIYLIGRDGSGLRKLTTEPQISAGSPKWSPDGREVLFYELPGQQTFDAHSGGGTSTIVSVEVATGRRTVRASGPGLKVSPQFLGPDRIGYMVKTQSGGSLAFTSGETGSPRDMANPSWSQDGTRVVYHAGQSETMHHYTTKLGSKVLGIRPDAGFEFVYASGFPSLSPDGQTLVVSERGPAPERVALVLWDANLTHPRRIYSDDVTLMGLQWSRDGRWIAFAAGAFFTANRPTRPAKIMVMSADGAQMRVLTGQGNSGFPSWSPDGTEIVYRYWNGNEHGLRIVNVATGQSRVLTTGEDNLPSWSPKGNTIVFTRYAPDERFHYDEFDIYSIRPDGSGLKRLTDSEGNDAHTSWSPDGNFILWSSSRFGYKDESPLVISQLQPYGELFMMNADGSNQRPLTDNPYEEGTPAWLPERLLKRK